MTTEQRQRIYPSLDAFYAANEARRGSGEADYGCWWMEERPYPKYRISYVRGTGEVYAVALTGRNSRRGDGDEGAQVEVLGIVPPDKNDPLSMRTYYRTLDRILEGWPDHCGHPNGLAWVRERLKAYAPNDQPHRPL